MTVDEARTALAAAQTTDAVRSALRACERAMRDGTADDVDEVVETLLPYARHANARVRQEIAEMCDLFPADDYGDVIALLEKDVDPFVCAATASAIKRRSLRKKETAKAVQLDQALADALAEIEAEDGKAGRRRAERVLRIATDQLVVRLDHELKRQRQPLEIALDLLAAEIDQPVPAKSVLVERHQRVREAFTYVWSIMKRARVQATRVRAKYEDESLLDIVEQARRQLAIALGEGAAGVEVAVTIDRDLRLDADRHALLQAIENVIKNAVEACASSGGKQVRVRGELQSNASEVAIAIADDGPGMSAAELARLFVPFGSVKPGGTGVGMLTARKMIEDVHGGVMTIASEQGKGTIVTMVVPARR